MPSRYRSPLSGDALTLADKRLVRIRGEGKGAAYFLGKSLAVLAVYFLLAKIGLELASIHPSATPIWPPSGLAIAAVLLLGYRIAPAIFGGAFLANATTAGNLATSFAISVGNTLECLLAAYLINRWSDGVRTFDTPAAITKFTLIALCATAVSASIGVSSLSIAGFAAWPEFRSIWITWWLGDVAGAVLFAPLVLLWARGSSRNGSRNEWHESVAVLAAAIVVAIVAFSPLLPDLTYRGALGFLAVLPLLWAALRRGRRETATVAVILSAVAVWGQQAGAGPFNQDDANASFLFLLAFMVSASLPSLALSAAIHARKSTEAELRTSESRMREVSTRQSLLLAELSHRVNNMLAVIQSIITRTLSDELPAEQLSAKLRDRLHALARAHELLTDSSWEGARLRQLVNIEVEPYAKQVECEGPDVLLTARNAQSFALLVHELTTNSCKHGALSTREGRVKVAWSVDRGQAEPCFRFSWTERNGPQVKPPARRGFGLRLLERAIDVEEGSRPVIAFDAAGFRFEVEVPAERVLVGPEQGN
jgi:two-component sensor histidine kinase/integral membrane sensor domain MASE1